MRIRFELKIKLLVTFALATVLLISLNSVSAQTSTHVLVIHNVNLRSDPSVRNDPITLLHPPTDLELVSDNKIGGYYP